MGNIGARHRGADDRFPATDQERLELLRSRPPPVRQAANVGLLLRLRRSDLVEQAVEEGAVEPNLPLPQFWSGDNYILIHETAKYEGISLLRCLIIKHGVDPTSRTSDDWTPLHAAIKGGQTAAALWLINEVPAIDIEGVGGSKGFTPLALAAQKGMLEVLKALVAKGVDLNRIVGEPAISALGWAIGAHREEAACYLVEAGASWFGGDPGVLSEALSCVGEGQQEVAEDGALLIAVAHVGFPGVIKFLLLRMRAKGQPAEILAKLMGEAARSAADFGMIGCLQTLVAEGLEFVGGRTIIGVMEGGTYRSVDLHAAAAHGHQEVAAFLLEHGCDPLEPDGTGLTASEYAAAMGRLSFLRWFSRRCPAVRDRVKANPITLRVAAERGHVDVVKWLVGEGADPRSILDGRHRPRLQPAVLTSLRKLVAAQEEAKVRAAAEVAAKAEQEEQEAELAAIIEACLQPKPEPERPPPLEEYLEAHVPDDLVCPITYQIFENPAFLVADGVTYSRAAIKQYLAFCREHGKPLTAPTTNLQIVDPADARVVPNVRCRRQVLDYRAAKEREWEAAERRWRKWTEEAGGTEGYAGTWARLARVLWWRG